MFLHISVTTHTCIFCCSSAWQILHMQEFVFCDFAISCMLFSSEEYVLISNFNVHFFHSFCTYQTCNKGFSANCIVTLVTYDVLCVIFYHLTCNCILSIFCFVTDKEFLCTYYITVDTFLLLFIRG